MPQNAIFFELNGKQPRVRPVAVRVKKQTCKPGSVSHSVIDLGRMSPSVSCSLPPVRMVPENRSGAGSSLPFGLTVYLALQPMGRTASDVATGTGGLLPRLFTLVPAEPGRLFSVTLPRIFTRLPVRKHGALCCPDFPPRLRRATEQSANFYKCRKKRKTEQGTRNREKGTRNRGIVGAPLRGRPVRGSRLLSNCYSLR